ASCGTIGMFRFRQFCIHWMWLMLEESASRSRNFRAQKWLFISTITSRARWSHQDFFTKAL
ncbi:MAG TPA: hypothetical protein VFW00_13225, partial [Rhodocyclaceae bacterium]|nr:hypothetical protein [Rhodocyclaceae bacterium]